MKKKVKRDIEKGYTNKQMAAKLRRLADDLEKGKQFRTQIAGERILAIKNLMHYQRTNSGSIELCT